MSVSMTDHVTLSQSMVIEHDWHGLFWHFRNRTEGIDGRPVLPGHDVLNVLAWFGQLCPII